MKVKLILLVSILALGLVQAGVGRRKKRTSKQYNEYNRDDDNYERDHDNYDRDYGRYDSDYDTDLGRHGALRHGRGKGGLRKLGGLNLANLLDEFGGSKGYSSGRKRGFDDFDPYGGRSFSDYGGSSRGDYRGNFGSHRRGLSRGPKYGGLSRDGGYGGSFHRSSSLGDLFGKGKHYGGRYNGKSRGGGRLIRGGIGGGRGGSGFYDGGHGRYGGQGAQESFFEEDDSYRMRSALADEDRAQSSYLDSLGFGQRGVAEMDAENGLKFAKNDDFRKIHEEKNEEYVDFNDENHNKQQHATSLNFAEDSAKDVGKQTKYSNGRKHGSSFLLEKDTDVDGEKFGSRKSASEGETELDTEFQEKKAAEKLLNAQEEIEDLKYQKHYDLNENLLSY